MGKTFSLLITLDCVKTRDAAEHKRVYESCYKPILAWFYHEKVPFSWALPALHLEVFAKKHGEFIDIIRDLAKGDMLEFVGGGYYNPVFPLLTPTDCVSQIALFNDTFRRTLGHCPAGIGFDTAFWTPQLIAPYNRCGMRFVALDAGLLPPELPSCTPLLTENLGKTIAVIPVEGRALPREGCTPADWLEDLHALFRHSVEQRPEAEDFVAAVRISPDRLAALTATTWMSDFVSRAKQYFPELILTTALRFLKTSPVFLPAWVPPGKNLYDLLQANRPLRLLYARLLHMRLLIDQCRGDKTRKNAAAEILWQAQNGDTFCCGDSKPKESAALRRNAYRHIILAEKITREVRPVAPNFTSLTGFDFDADGVDEYLCRFGAYNAFVSTRGGVLFELDVFQSATNYCGTRGCFVDHLLPPDWQKDFNALASPGSLFPALRYQVLFFHRNRRELRFMATGKWGPGKLEITLQKNYFFAENSIQVQYILSNKSAERLECILAIESCYALPHEDIKVEKVTVPNQGVTCVQLTDKANNVSLVTEPNEAAGFLVSPPGPTAATIHHWHCKMEGGQQLEKMITMTINTPKKKSKRPKNLPAD